MKSGKNNKTRKKSREKGTTAVAAALANISYLNIHLKGRVRQLIINNLLIYIICLVTVFIFHTN